jgi:hypothetical protein
MRECDDCIFSDLLQAKNKSDAGHLPAILNLAKMRLKYHKIMISANVISTGYGILESIKIHIENCC